MKTDTFHCDGCARDIDRPKSPGGVGYGVAEDGRVICYVCGAQETRARMADPTSDGREILYLVRDGPDWIVTDWPGKLRFPVGVSKTGRHNMAGSRIDVWFHGPDGRTWWGVQYGENTQVIHCRRTAI